MQGFVAELRRRNVLRAAAFYAAAGWLLVQVATQVFPFFDIPNSVVRSVVLVIAAGFLPAMLLSWFYELTPSGIRRESELAADASIPRASGRAIDRWIIAVLLLAVLLLVADRLRPRAVAPAGQAAQAVADKSIAVLPFENLSDDKANAYFAEGIQDEILTKLARIGALRVISRSSTQQYSARPGNLAEIAKQLGVSNILEGSVQKIDDAVHINVQLIRAASDDHIWADTYDRKLDNVFGVEAEVAQSIAQALQAQLSGREAQTMDAKPTTNMVAYDAYLRGLGFEAKAYNGNIGPAVHQAHDAYAEAVRLDPAFALAWAHLSIVDSYIYFDTFERSPAALENMRTAADTALKLRPDLGEAYLAQGYYHYRALNDYDGGLKLFGEALQRLPNNADVLAAIAYIERRQGKWQESTAHLEQATQLDPRNVSMLSGLVQNYVSLRQLPQALHAIERALVVDPDAPGLLAQKAGIYQGMGDLDAAERVLAPLPLSVDQPDVYERKVRQLILRRRFAEGIAAIQDEMATRRADVPDAMTIGGDIYLGLLQKATGHADAAHQACGRGLDKLDRIRKAGADDIGLEGVVALLEACTGDKTAALSHAQQAVDLNAKDAMSRSEAESTQAWVEVLCGDYDAVLAKLPRLLKDPGGFTQVDLRQDPMWDPLRQDPRFIVLAGGG